MHTPAFRRRILIEPAPGCVVAELEDDWHRMVGTVRHDGATASAVEGEMKRWPWTTCRGAITKLAETFNGQALAAFARRGDKTRNCTHLYDLAVFAAGHASGTEPIAYDIAVTDPVDGLSQAQILRGGTLALAWTLRGTDLVAPAELVGQSLYSLNEWIAGLDTAGQEAARILRWACILGLGRAIDIPAGISGTTFAGGNCFTFQPDVAAEAVRRPDVPRDFSLMDTSPMADRSQMFGTHQELSS